MAHIGMWNKPRNIICFFLIAWFVGTGILMYQSCSSVTARDSITESRAFIPCSAYTVTRSISSETFQISPAKDAHVFYTIRINCVSGIGSTATGTVMLQSSMDGGSNWIILGQLENQTSASVGINITTAQTAELCGVIHRGEIARITNTLTGNTTITYVRGLEYY